MLAGVGGWLVELGKGRLKEEKILVILGMGIERKGRPSRGCVCCRAGDEAVEIGSGGQMGWGWRSAVSLPGSLTGVPPKSSFLSTQIKLLGLIGLNYLANGEEKWYKLLSLPVISRYIYGLNISWHLWLEVFLKMIVWDLIPIVKLYNLWNIAWFYF